MGGFWGGGMGGFPRVSGRTRTDELEVTAVVAGMGVYPLTAGESRESVRRLKEMAFRDESTRRWQRRVNELESGRFDVELAAEEETFEGEASEVEQKGVRAAVEEVKRGVEVCHRGERGSAMDRLVKRVEEAEKVVEAVQKRVEAKSEL